jgi:hypothetical protein
MKCKICNREADEKVFCTLHLKAYKNIQEKFIFWQQAVNISWDEYLVEVQKNSLTGEWAKEVITDLIVEQKGNVK